MIRLSQVGRKDPDRAQVKVTVREKPQDDREAASRASYFDPVVRRVLGEMEYLRAVREHGRAALMQVQAPCIELREC